MDVLSASGLINYFGKSKVVDNIVVKPIHIQKGNTNLALYGMGNIRDERLHRLFNAQNVGFQKIAEEVDDLFNIFVLHQNRYIYVYICIYILLVNINDFYAKKKKKRVTY